jgi:hypothetical protein
MPNNNHPHLQALHELYQDETQAFRKVHRMIDLFESIIKTYTVVILSEYIKQNKLSDSAKGLLSQGLRTPSLGTWQLFSRVLFEELQKDNYTWLVGEFPKEFLSLDKALNNEKTNVIALRNGYAHGATPTDVQCEEDIKKFEPFLTQLIASKWFNTSSLEVRDNKVNLVGSEGELSLHPILLYRNEESAVSFAFFNDIKNDKIGLLNYPLSKHYREKDFYAEFHEHLPLNEWKKSGNNEFYQRIEELTETFKGRTAEREQLLRFVEDKSKGYFSIQGNPGIGKSALIAQFFKDLRVNEKLKHIQVVEYFIRRGTAQANTDYLLSYLIKRTDELFPQGREIRAEDKNTLSLQQQLFSKWRLWAENSKGNKLLFLIDGLDEGVEDAIVKYLPRENFENILIIYGSRPGGHRSIDELWSTLPTEYHTKLELSGLSKQDIRALIYEVANKYELEKESPWIDAVEKRSQGNPLYLKLLCNAIENGSVGLNDINALPEKIEYYYKAILQRYAQDTLDGDALLSGLYTFAAAKDYLTFSHLAILNKLGEAQVERVGSTLKEVLYENPLTEDVLDYQLFHESFREYLLKEKTLKITDASERIIDFCATWQELEGSWEQRYCLEHYATHLNESKKELHHKELLALFQNEAYARTQKKVLKQFDATKKLYQLALLKAGEINDNDLQLEAALKLVDLKYEEANDVPKIVALVANNEIDLALKRIESFEGNDEEEVKRKFIMYILCLMELTFLESKNKDFKETALEKILKHFDEQLPIDHSILNWNNFFPSYLILQLIYEIRVLQLNFDYKVILYRTEKFDFDWVDDKKDYNEMQTELISECKNIFSYNAEKLRLAKKKDSKKSINRNLFKDRQEKFENHIQILIDEIRKNKINSLEEFREFNKENDLNSNESIVKKISDDLIELEKFDFLESLYEFISDDSIDKVMNLVELAEKYLNENLNEKALLIVKKCELLIKNGKDVFIKDLVERLILKLKVDLGNYHEVLPNFYKLDSLARNIFLKNILDYLVFNSKDEELFEFLINYLAHRFNIDKLELEGLKRNISLIYFNKNEIITSELILNNIKDEGTRNEVLFHYLLDYIKKEQNDKLNFELNSITDSYEKNKILSKLLISLIIENLEENFYDFINFNESINWENIEIKEINTAFINNPNPKLILYFLNILEPSLKKDGFINNLLPILIIKQEFDFLIEISNHIQNPYTKSLFLLKISTVHFVAEKFDNAETILKTSLDFLKNYINDNNSVRENINEIEQYLCFQNKSIENYIIDYQYQDKRSSRFQMNNDVLFSFFIDIEFLDNAFVLLNEYYPGRINNFEGEINDVSILLNYFISKRELNKARICLDILKLKKAAKNFFSIDKKYSQKIIKTLIKYDYLELLNEVKNVIKDERLYWFIAAELIKSENFKLAEEICNEITKTFEIQSCWKEIAQNHYLEYGWQKSLLQVSKFQSDDARLFYLKGLAEAIGQNEIDYICVQEFLPTIVKDSESIETLLQKYAINELFFGSASKEQINRLNKTLNIQWAIDIKNQFPSSEEIQRQSTNVEAWLHEIADEDNRDDIVDWAKRVKDGKWTEEKFQERLKEKL